MSLLRAGVGRAMMKSGVFVTLMLPASTSAQRVPRASDTPSRSGALPATPASASVG